MAIDPSFPNVMRSEVLSFIQASGTTINDFITPGSAGTIITAFHCNNQSALDLSLQVIKKVSGVDYFYCQVTVPANSGYDGLTPMFDILNDSVMDALTKDINGRRELFVGIGQILRLKLPLALVSPAVVNVFADGGNL